MTEKQNNKKVIIAYALIILVIFIWSVSPLLNTVMNKKCSVALRSTIMGVISVGALLTICAKKLKNLNKEYFKYAFSTGAFVALASIVQKVGLLYTTPTKYAFLENLSCVVVPVILFFAIKKKPSILTIIASLTCLVGSFILSGLSFSDGGLFVGKGELLCALAGVLYGVNIAFTGINIKKFDALLYILVQQIASTIVSVVAVILFALIKVNGAPIEQVFFVFDFTSVAILIILALVSNVLCWFLRTYAMKFINPTTVSIIMPFSAVVTGVLSVIMGMDKLTLSLVLGGIVSLGAVILSSLADAQQEKRAKKE